MTNTVRIDPVGFEDGDDIFEDASEQAFINPEEEFYEASHMPVNERQAGSTASSSHSPSDFQEGRRQSSPGDFSHTRQMSLQYEDAIPQATASTSPGQTNLSLHRAVFDGDIATAEDLLASMTEKEMVALDPQGNTALHIAVLRRRASVVLALLDKGFPPDAPSRERWTALDDAITLKDKELVKVLHSRQTAAVKADLKAKKGQLLDSLNSMPNVSFQLKWELGSPVLGMLLRKYAPTDTYEVWKLGTKMRVDGSLMGMDDKRTSLLPQWKRGHFSLLFDGATTPATILLCDHAKKKYLDLSKEKKKHKPSLDDEASMIISEGAGKTKMRASEFHFKVQKSWFGGDVTEKIEGWRTKIYEAAGKMVAVTINKKATIIPATDTYDDYLDMEIPKDAVTEEPVDPYSIDTSPGKPIKGGTKVSEDAGKKKAKQARRMTGKCWMAENFPISLTQLLPILEVVGNANKHIARVGKFLHKYGDMSLFPVKLQVPLMYTVYALISFRKFKIMEASSSEDGNNEEWYALPTGYKLKTFDEISASRRSRRSQSWDSTEDIPEVTSEQDAKVLKQMGL